MREESTYQALLDAYTQRGHEMLALEREIAHLRRGIEAYREAYQELSDRCRRGGCNCRVHAWESEEKKRREVEEEQCR